MGAGRERHLADGEFQRAFTGGVERADFAQAGRGNVGIVEAARQLNGARGFDALPHFG